MNQEFIIPSTEHHPDNSLNQAFSRSLENPITQFDNPALTRRYLEQIDAVKETKRQYDERSEILKIGHTLEQVRRARIEDAILNSRRRKLGAFIDQLAFGIQSKRSDDQSSLIWKRLIDTESVVGGNLLNANPDELHYFYYYDNDEWFWQVENEKTGARQAIRYAVDQNNGIRRSIDGQPFEILSSDERQRFVAATELYGTRVLSDIYGRQDLV